MAQRTYTAEELQQKINYGPYNTAHPIKKIHGRSTGGAGWRLKEQPKKEETWTERIEEEEQAVVDEFNKGIEWVETAAINATEVVKDAGVSLLETDKAIYKDVVGGAWNGVKSGLHGAVDLTVAGAETVLEQLGLPVLFIGGGLLLLYMRGVA